MRGNALVKTIPVIGGVLLWLGFAIELSVAASHFAAVSNRGTVAPVKAFTHPEIGIECVIHAELYSSRVQQPCLIARRVAGYVVEKSRTVRVDHEGCNSLSHRAECGGRNDVRLTGDGKAGCWVKAVAVSHRHSAYQCGGAWVENFSLVDWSPKSVVGDYGSRIEQRAEISRLERVNWSGVTETWQHSGAQARPVDVREEESFVMTVVNPGNIDRTTQGEAEGVVF